MASQNHPSLFSWLFDLMISKYWTFFRCRRFAKQISPTTNQTHQFLISAYVMFDFRLVYPPPHSLCVFKSIVETHDYDACKIVKSEHVRECSLTSMTGTKQVFIFNSFRLTFVHFMSFNVLFFKQLLSTSWRRNKKSLYRVHQPITSGCSLALNVFFFILRLYYVSFYLRLSVRVSLIAFPCFGSSFLSIFLFFFFLMVIFYKKLSINQFKIL